LGLSLQLEFLSNLVGMVVNEFPLPVFLFENIDFSISLTAIHNFF
jgi:hypothetical protein